jgi:hypothetical protein
MAFLVGAIIILGLFLIASSIVIIKCLRKRSQSTRTREAMQMKRHQFATQMGMSMF